MMKMISEGQNLPNGFYVKFGNSHEPGEYRDVTVATLGPDGLVESLHKNILPPLSDYTRHWITLGFHYSFGYFKKRFNISYRVRSWTNNIFTWEYSRALDD